MGTVKFAACASAISASLAELPEALPSGARRHGYQVRHVRAWHNGGPIVGMIRALALYADMHAERFESPLGEDYVLGPAGLDMLKGLRTLLNGELGGLDCGTLDTLAHDMAEAAGFNRGALSE